MAPSTRESASAPVTPSSEDRHEPIALKGRVPQEQPRFTLRFFISLPFSSVPSKDPYGHQLPGHRSRKAWIRTSIGGPAVVIGQESSRS